MPTLISTSIAGYLMFAMQLIVSLFLLRLAAIKLHGTGVGQGLASIVF